MPHFFLTNILEERMMQKVQVNEFFFCVRQQSHTTKALSLNTEQA
jgi:hypothetical protein